MDKKEIKTKILVVEDDKFLRNLLVRKLEEDNFNVLTSIDGNEALEKIKKETPDLILLDLILPGLNGFEILRQIKQDSNLNKIPVIILSNLGQQEEVKKGIQLGAVDYLVKAHFTPAEIVSKIRSILNKVK